MPAEHDDRSLVRFWLGGHSFCAGPLIILAAAAVAVAPLLFRGPSCGHDFDFHLVSWLDCFSSWRHGIFYPHWTASANYGAGEPRFVFYPPLTWMLGAALGAILPWTLVPVALTFLLLAGTGFATRALAREVLTDGAATLAGCAALFSGYALYTAYERTAYGELAGGFWIPLLLLYALRNRAASESKFSRALDGSTAPLALVLAGCWLSNIPLGVMACYLLAAVAITAAILARSLAPVIRAAIAGVLGIAVSAFYLIPAVWEQRWIDVGQVTGDPGERIENSWLFGRHSNPLLQLHDVELRRVSMIAVSMIAVALVGLLIAWRRDKLTRWWISLALIPVAILFLQFPVSLPLWNLLPKLRFLQFPWRWLVTLEAPMAIFFAAAVWSREAARRRIAVSAVLALFVVLALAFTTRYFFQACDDEDAVSSMVGVYGSGPGFVGTDEYAPPGADDTLVASGLPAGCLTLDGSAALGEPLNGNEAAPVWSAAQGSCETTLNWQIDQPERKHIRAVLPHAGFLILRLRSYPAWQLKINGSPIPSQPRRADGLIVVAVPQGVVDLTADWTATSDLIAGRWLTALAVLLLAGLWFVERKPSRAHL
jgi:hypothetical protein